MFYVIRQALGYTNLYGRTHTWNVLRHGDDVLYGCFGDHDTAVRACKREQARADRLAVRKAVA